MNVNNIYKNLFELLTSPHGDGAMALTSTSGTARRELLIVAKKEECLPELYAQWEPEGLLSPSESDEHELFMRRRESGGALVRALPAGVVLLGGAGIQRHGLPGVKRSSTDLQVLIPDFGAVGRLHEVVRPLGYRLRGASEWMVPLREPMHRGAATYRYATAGANDGAVAIEVQVAGVPIDARRHIPFTEFADKTARLDGLACVGLDPTWQLLQCFADFGARGAPITVRQIADLNLLLKVRGSKVDHAYLRRRIEQWNLWGGLKLLREAIVAKRLSAQLDWGELGQVVDASSTRPDAPAERGARPARSGKPARSAPRGERAGTLVKGAFDMLAGPRDNDLASKAARSQWLVSTVLNAGHRVRGVQVSSKSHSAPQLLRMDGSLYLATGAGLFLLSLVDLSEGARADLTERLRSASRPTVLARWTGATPAPLRDARDKREKRDRREKRDLRDLREQRDAAPRGAPPAARPSRG